MEGSEKKALPKDNAPKKAGMNKMIALIIVIILVVAAIVGALVLTASKPNNSPTVRVTISSTLISAGQPVTYNASTTTDPEGDILKFTWNFGDAMQDTTSGAVATHVYSFPGIYFMMLIVDDQHGNTANNLATPLKLEVVNPVVAPSNTSKPIALVAASANNIAAGTTVTFNGNGSAGFAQGRDGPIGPSIANVSDLQWIWGDDTPSAHGTPAAVGIYNHTFAVGKNVVYPAKLIVTGENGQTQTYYYNIIVGAGSSGNVKNPDKFIMATIGEPDYLDPAVDYETAGGEICQNVYETLVWYDGNSAATLKPLLATSVPTVANGGIAIDGLTYTFNLRSNVKFADGNTMTAEDVRYSIERVLKINDPTGPAWILGQVLIPDYYSWDVTNTTQQPGYMAAIHGAIWAKTPTQVVFNLTMPYPAFTYCLAFTVGSVVSKAYVEANGGTQFGAQSDFMNRHTCGTGPYSLLEWAPNQQIIMQRNDAYWGAAPALKYVIIKKVQDVGTRVLMLKSGDADSVYVPRDHKADVTGQTNLRIVEGIPTFNIDFLGLNQNIKDTSGSLKVPANFFADVNMRLAFASAFNYGQLINTTYGGSAIEPNGPIPAGMFGYDASVPKYDYNLTLAAAFLKKTINPSTGTSYAETGFDMTLYYNAGNTPRQTSCFMMANGLNALKTQGLINGTINIQVQGLDWPVYLAKQRHGDLPAFFLGWAPDYADPDDYVNPFIYSAGTYAHTIGFANATLDQWIVDAAKELNPTARAQLYHNISMGVYENAPFIWTAQATNFHVERAWVTGYYFNPMYSGYYYPIFNKA